MRLFWKRKGPAGPRPQDIDCGQVMQRLYEYIDGELDDPDLVARIRAHLELCQRCYPHYGFERAFLRFLAEVRDGAPPNLRRRVFQRILEEETRKG
ncbi:MAG: zf-HC2 domain-containing protein [Gemmatimonadetes bacterium]|nr:zf-HC2 domain-containing protein [Gemmatimonadota bacterium]